MFYPQAHEGATNCEIGSASSAVGKGSANTAGYSYILVDKGDDGYCFWPFDVSSVPRSAEINSVTCKARGRVTGSGGSAYFQLYSGTTAKGSSYRVSSTSSNGSVCTLSVGTWTREELCSVRLRTMVSAGSSDNKLLSYYGADLTVTYTYQSEKFMLKLSGSYHDIPRVFQKIDDIWIEQDDLNNVVVSENGLVNGGEIESTGPVNPSFTIGGNIYYFEDGMTWEEWVDSSYNTLGLYVGNNIFYGALVFCDDGTEAIVDATETYVNPTWLIAENHAYSLYYL